MKQIIDDPYSRPNGKRHDRMALNLHTIKRSTTPLVWLLASMLLLFPVSVHALPGIILCIESDGRIEVESSRSGDCASKIMSMVQETHAGYEGLEAKEGPGIDCPTSCVDLLLLASPADGQTAPTLKQAPRAAQVLFPAATLHTMPRPHASTSARLASEPPALLSSLTPLRTVVLLI